jgi:cytochrome o ubiquinol oxidase subunit 2
MLKKLLGIGVPVIALIGVIVMMFVAAQGVSMPVIDTRGEIADAQRDTLYFAVITMLVIIIPVFLLVAFIPWRYRASNKRATYRPGWTSSKRLEVLWWGVPIIIVAILSVLTWHTSHSLDPYRPLKSSKQPIKVQVVAMQWKWLFIYPEENVASIGEFAMPTDTPVNFTITSDAPMNSFWIPQLGGQIYAMEGMVTKTHLIADKTGTFQGASAEISGIGFAGMRFAVEATTEREFEIWLTKVRQSPHSLGREEYKKLALPSENNKVTLYSTVDPGLYNGVVMRFMDPKSEFAESDKHSESETHQMQH